MVSKFNRSLLATLVLGLAVTTSNARAGAASAEAAKLNTDFATMNSYACLNGLCVGMTVRVNGGEWIGQAGQIVSIDAYQDTITVVNSSGYLLYPRSYDVSADYAQPSATGCVGSVCIGDQVRMTVGLNAGRIGTVVDADDYNYTATVLVGGQYLIEDVRDLTLSVRPSVPRAYGNYPRNCAYGDYVYDIYRGCVRITYAYPRPSPRSIPYPRPLPQPYPQPSGRPVPPRPYPLPRGPMPGAPRGPSMPSPQQSQGPRGPSMPSPQQSQGPRGPSMPSPQQSQGPRGPSMPSPQQSQGPRGPSMPSPQQSQGPRGPSMPSPQQSQGPRGPSMPSPQQSQGPRGPQGGNGSGGGAQRGHGGHP